MYIHLQQAGDDQQLKLCVELMQSAVNALLVHLNDRKSILAEYYERWKAYTDTGREFKTQWQQFVNDARQVGNRSAVSRFHTCWSVDDLCLPDVENRAAKEKLNQHPLPVPIKCCTKLFGQPDQLFSYLKLLFTITVSKLARLKSSRVCVTLYIIQTIPEKHLDSSIVCWT